MATLGTRVITLASGLTTDTTSAVRGVPHLLKTFYGEVTGTGAVTQTQEIFGSMDDGGVNGILLATITLSGTTRAQTASPPVSATFPFYYVVSTNTSGTGATGVVYASF